MKYEKIVLLAFLFCSCQHKNELIVSHTWEYDTGVYAGDFIDFPSGYATLRNDTILKDGIPRLYLLKFDHDLNELHVKSLTSDTTGIYISTEEFSK